MSNTRLDDLDGRSLIETEVSGRPTRIRYVVLGTACVLAIVTYIHRVGFATASAEFQPALGLSDRDVGLLMSAFMVAYGLLEVPWGYLGDRFGVRHTLTIIILGGSLTTAAVSLAAWMPTGIVGALGYLLVVRFLFGAFQGGTFPSIARMLSGWLPMTERGSAQGFVWMASRMGGSLAPIGLVALIQVTESWQLSLVLVAVLGLAWWGFFWPFFRDHPEDQTRVNRAECKLIESGRSPHAALPHGAVPWGILLRSRSVWALCAMYGCLGYSGNFFLSLLPTYLKNHRHLNSETTGLLTSLPFACGVGACLIGGVVSDQIIRRWGRRWGRRAVGATGLLVAMLAILAVPFVTDPRLLALLLCLTFFGNDLAMAPAWAAAADIGERHTGTLSGIMNMMASFTAAIMAPLTGVLFDRHSLVAPFVIFGLVYGLGVLCWLGVDATRTLTDKA